jgi:hypothetical protein
MIIEEVVYCDMLKVDPGTYRSDSYPHLLGPRRVRKIELMSMLEPE